MFRFKPLLMHSPVCLRMTWTDATLWYRPPLLETHSHGLIKRANPQNVMQYFNDKLYFTDTQHKVSTVEKVFTSDRDKRQTLVNNTQQTCPM